MALRWRWNENSFNHEKWATQSSAARDPSCGHCIDLTLIKYIVVLADLPVVV